MPGDAHLDTPMSLHVRALEDVASGIRSFELVQLDGGDLPPFTAGSHVKVQAPNGALRKYSLCNDPSERNRYVIAVKRDDQGRGGSVSMHTDLRVGDVLPTSAPENAFPLAGGARAHLFIAGGIGITPILSMIRSLEVTPEVPWKLVYLTRAPEFTAFADDIRRLGKPRAVTIHHDHGDPARAFDCWPLLEKPGATHVYCCGPRPLMEAVRDMTGHWSPKNVHFESFEQGGSRKADDVPFTVKLSRSGLDFEVPVGQSILEAMRAHGGTAPSSCESGTCGTCRTGLLVGEADHRDMVLLEDEKATQIMICVSRAKSNRLILDL
jgi:phthalate 4,5-dioxygenase reductase subunit